MFTLTSKRRLSSSSFHPWVGWQQTSILLYSKLIEYMAKLLRLIWKLVQPKFTVSIENNKKKCKQQSSFTFYKYINLLQCSIWNFTIAWKIIWVTLIILNRSIVVDYVNNIILGLINICTLFFLKLSVYAVKLVTIDG